MKRTSLSFLLVLLGLGFLASSCNSFAGTRGAGAMPEIRYYMIADT